jgi:hypothetical protein
MAPVCANVCQCLTFVSHAPQRLRHCVQRRAAPRYAGGCPCLDARRECDLRRVAVQRLRFGREDSAAHRGHNGARRMPHGLAFGRDGLGPTLPYAALDDAGMGGEPWATC